MNLCLGFTTRICHHTNVLVEAQEFQPDVAALKGTHGDAWFAAVPEILLIFKFLNWKRNGEGM